jgi:hypothetical protein
MKMKRIYLIVVLMFFLAPTLAPALAQEDTGQDRTSGPAGPVDDKGLSPEKRIEELKTRLEWVTFQKKQYEKYIAGQERVLDDLEQQRREMERLEMELAPFLTQTVERLEKVVAADMDFLAVERERRIRFLQKSLEDPGIGLNERLRRILEALRVEAGYGRDVEKTEAEIMLDGERTRVDLLRLGRIALFYKTGDNRRFGWRLKNDESWREIEGTEVRAVKRAFDIVDKRQAAQLVRLPLEPKQP